MSDPTIAATVRLDEALTLLAVDGGHRYGVEPISQLQHALQSATLAEAAGASPALIAAALLHDIGHLIDDQAPVPGAANRDRCHQELAAAYLAPAFDDDVLEPIRLHVAAKRYLCAVDPDYTTNLSVTSRRTLQLQGGAFDAAAARAFIALPRARDAIQVRRWDDSAKEPAAVTPDLAHFRAYAFAARRRS